MNFKISVLFPAYNAEKYVFEAVSSILSQTYQDFELLIADDASTDRTKEVLEGITDARFRFYHNQKNLGKTTTVDKLFQHASGDLVTIHDADDISMPDRFTRQVEEFLAKPELGMCGTGFISISESGEEILETVYMTEVYQDILAGIDNKSQFHGPTMMIRKSVINDLGQLYRPYFSKTNEDTDLAYRIAEKYKVTNIPEVLYRYRILNDSACRKCLDAKSRNLYKLVVFLAKERAEKGCDSLDSGDYETINKFMNGLLAQYTADKSLEHREAASYLMYYKLYKKAIDEAIKAVLNSPGRAVNWRTLFYCTRKAVLRQ